MTGTQLRRARLRAGYSQRQLARRLRVSQSLVSRVETGQVAVSPRLAVRVARVLP